MDGLTALGTPYSTLRRSVLDDVTGNPLITSAPTGEVVQRSALLPLGRNDAGRLVPAIPQGALDAFGAIQAPQRAYNGDLQIWDPSTGHVSDQAMEAANGLAALAMTGGLGGAAVRQGETVLGSGPIRAYHGSPHDFDRFDISKIGTGEGAQVYGHGLYFAGNEAVAKGYRDALSGVKFTHQGRLLSGAEENAANVLDMHGGDPFKAEAFINSVRQTRNADQPYLDATVSALRGLDPKAIGTHTGGRVYEVGIDADPAKLLNWDAPVASQPRVRDLAGDMGVRLRSDATGGDAWRAITDRSPIPGSDMGGLIDPEFGSAAAAAQRLREAGVPGIKYLDGGSRVAGDGSHNYVTFSDDIVSILRKYGLAGMAALGAGAGALAQPGEAQANGLNALAPHR